MIFVNKHFIYTEVNMSTVLSITFNCSVLRDKQQQTFVMFISTSVNTHNFLRKRSEFQMYNTQKYKHQNFEKARKTSCWPIRVNIIFLIFFCKGIKFYINLKKKIFLLLTNYKLNVKNSWPLNYQFKDHEKKIFLDFL